MLYLIHYHWVWLLLATALGIAIGWSTCGEPRGEGIGGWIVPAAVLFGLGLVVSMLRLLPGRFGYWIDIALLDFAAYLVGCCLGCLAGGRGRPVAIPIEGLGQAPVEQGARPISLVVVDDSIADARARQPPFRAPETVSLHSNDGEKGGPYADEGGHPGRRPPALAGPRQGLPDDLKRIKGIGPQNERRLHGLGIWHYDQIAAWSGENITWVASFLKFPGRIDRENWVAQAKILADGGTTEFAKRVDAGKVPTSRGGPGDTG